MKKKNMTYVAIVDDKKSLRTALQQRLNAFDNYEVLFTAENGKDFLDKMAESRKAIEPDVVLMDIDMPVMNGIEAVAEGKVRFPLSKYLMLTVFDEDDKIFNAIKAGADGYLLKDEPVDKIKEAIINLLNDEGAPMSPSIARRAFNLLMNAKVDVNVKSSDNSIEYNLTEREKEILLKLIDGLEYKEIALELDASPNTIRNHVTKIYKKLHVTSRAQAMKLFRKS
jgi:DNA-binding NarL/FixJ family response regulator